MEQEPKLDLWAIEENLYPDGDITSVNAASYRAFARLLLAQGRFAESLILLARLWEPANAGGQTTIMIEILLLQAMALQEQGDFDQVARKLAQALTLAEPGGFIRAFVNEGAPLARLLQESLARGVAATYVRRLLAAFPAGEPIPSMPAQSPIRDSGLVEPLSEREIEVVQLITAGLKNREIAERLYLSLNTVKAHTRNIYGKLDVHTRTQAVNRARNLGLLPPA